MNLSISNLAWPGWPDDLALRLHEVGVCGVEIAPTSLWPKIEGIDLDDVRAFAQSCASDGLSVSGVQSLLFGRPDLQLFDPTTWDALETRLTTMIEVAGILGADVAVFGSPRNRVRGTLSDARADGLAADFFDRLLPALAREGVVLTLEPNAPAYGADYLTTYGDVVRLADLIGSPLVRPQVDTGCLAMVGDDAAAAVERSLPGHVHVSAPDLVPPSDDDLDHVAVRDRLAASNYQGWVVLEMLQSGAEPMETALQAAGWLHRIYGERMSREGVS